MHGHGGILLEHLKNHALSWDMGPADRMLWYSTTSWMMWNALVSSLLVRLVAGDDRRQPDVPGPGLAVAAGRRRRRRPIMGASPGFIMACRKAGLDLRAGRDLAVRIVGSAGAPLPPEGYAWICDQLGPEVQLNVGSGGTDVCSGLVQNNPLLPVWAGEISGRCLGADVHAFDEDGRRGRRRARRTRDHVPDAVDAGGVLGGRGRAPPAGDVLRPLARGLAAR